MTTRRVAFRTKMDMGGGGMLEADVTRESGSVGLLGRLRSMAGIRNSNDMRLRRLVPLQWTAMSCSRMSRDLGLPSSRASNDQSGTALSNRLSLLNGRCQLPR